MTASLRPGVVTIGVATDASGRARSVDIRSSRPTGVARRLFAGRNGEEVEALAGRMFSLCGFSHQLAARRAIAAARGEAASSRPRGEMIGLAAERLSESLRATALDWPRDAGDPSMAGLAAPLRDAMAAARLLATKRRDGAALNDCASAANRLAAAAEAFGLCRKARRAVEPGSFLDQAILGAQSEDFIGAGTPDALSPLDDRAVVAALRMQAESFAALPSLPGRVAETGAFARHWREAIAAAGSGLAARLAARVLAMQAALCVIERAVSGSADSDDEEAITAEALGAGEGFAALESARGRLYHWVRLGPDGLVNSYAIVAPTEWNFHPAGPFVAALLGAPLGSGGAARRRIGQLAAAFDPCVAVAVELRDVCHA